MTSWIDAVGNVRGRAPSARPAAPALLVGSHYDTVIDGGKYDGALGILTGIAAVKVALLEIPIAEGAAAGGGRRRRGRRAPRRQPGPAPAADGYRGVGPGVHRGRPGGVAQRRQRDSRARQFYGRRAQRQRSDVQRVAVEAAWRARLVASCARRDVRCAVEVRHEVDAVVAAPEVAAEQSAPTFDRVMSHHSKLAAGQAAGASDGAGAGGRGSCSAGGIGGGRSPGSNRTRPCRFRAWCRARATTPWPWPI